VAAVLVSCPAIPASRSPRSCIWRSSSAPLIRAIVTGCSLSAAVVTAPASAAASRRRSRQAETLLCAGSAQ
jgi:hypothetical protein